MLYSLGSFQVKLYADLTLGSFRPLSFYLRQSKSGCSIGSTLRHLPLESKYRLEYPKPLANRSVCKKTYCVICISFVRMPLRYAAHHLVLADPFQCGHGRTPAFLVRSITKYHLFYSNHAGMCMATATHSKRQKPLFPEGSCRFIYPVY